MNVNHPTSKSVARKRNVPKHLYHSIVLVWMVTFGTELTGKMQSSMNVNHPTSISVTRKRNVPKHMYHSSVFVGMVTFGTELTGKVKIDVLYQTRETDSVHHISRQRQESWSRVYLTKFRVLGTVFTLAEHSFFTLIEHFSLSRPADMQMSASKCLP